MVTQSHHAEMSAVKAIAFPYMPARVVTRDVSLKERRDEAVIPPHMAHLGTYDDWVAGAHSPFTDVCIEGSGTTKCIR